MSYEPGPWYYEGVEIGVEDLPEWIEAVTVKVRANSPTITTGPMGNKPCPTDAVLAWFKESNIDPSTVRISDFDLVSGIMELLGMDPYFTVDFHFENADDALRFKLAWGGL